MKPGWKTTEFWVTLGTTLWALFGHALPPTAQALVATVVPAAYSIGRAIAKAAAAPSSPAPASPVAGMFTGAGLK